MAPPSGGSSDPAARRRPLWRRPACSLCGRLMSPGHRGHLPAGLADGLFGSARSRGRSPGRWRVRCSMPARRSGSSRCAPAPPSPAASSGPCRQAPWRTRSAPRRWSSSRRSCWGSWPAWSSASPEPEVRVPAHRRDRSVVADLRVGFDEVVRSPLLRLVAIAFVLLSVLYFSVTYPFLQAASATFTTEADLATRLGLLSAAVTATSFIVSLTLANRVYERFGVAGAALVLPLVYVAGFGLWLVHSPSRRRPSSASPSRSPSAGCRTPHGAPSTTSFRANGGPRSSRSTTASRARSGRCCPACCCWPPVAARRATRCSGSGWSPRSLCSSSCSAIRRRYPASLLRTLRSGRAERVLEGGPGLGALTRDPPVMRGPQRRPGRARAGRPSHGGDAARPDLATAPGAALVRRRRRRRTAACASPPSTRSPRSAALPGGRRRPGVPCSTLMTGPRGRLWTSAHLGDAATVDADPGLGRSPTIQPGGPRVAGLPPRLERSDPRSRPWSRCCWTGRTGRSAAPGEALAPPCRPGAGRAVRAAPRPSVAAVRAAAVTVLAASTPSTVPALVSASTMTVRRPPNGRVTPCEPRQPPGRSAGGPRRSGLPGRRRPRCVALLGHGPAVHEPVMAWRGALDGPRPRASALTRPRGARSGSCTAGSPAPRLNRRTRPRLTSSWPC